MSTAVLEAGDGPPLVLFHGPGEYAARWFTVIPNLQATHRVIAPDLPGHGESAMEQVLEPVFANITSNKRPKRFSLRSWPKVQGQRRFFCLVHNTEKLMSYGAIPG